MSPLSLGRKPVIVQQEQTRGEAREDGCHGNRRLGCDRPSAILSGIDIDQGIDQTRDRVDKTGSIWSVLSKSGAGPVFVLKYPSYQPNEVTIPLQPQLNHSCCSDDTAYYCEHNQRNILHRVINRHCNLTVVRSVLYYFGILHRLESARKENPASKEEPRGQEGLNIISLWYMGLLK